MLPVEAPHTYSVAVPSRIVLWQHVGDLRPLGDITKEKWPVHAGVRTQDPELVCPTASPLPPLCYVDFLRILSLLLPL